MSADLSNDANAPTPLAFTLGNNIVNGSVVDRTDTRDFLTFTIHPGQHLTGLYLLSYTPNNPGFDALNFGAVSFVPGVTTPPPGEPYGGRLIVETEVGLDLLSLLGSEPIAGAGPGFTTPLGPGNYSYVIQQTGIPRVQYSLNFIVSPSLPLLGSRSLVGLLGGLLLGTAFVVERAQRRRLT